MKCRYLTISETQLQDMVQKELEKRRDELYEEVLRDVIPQFLAICMQALRKEHFGKIRLLRFLENVKNMYLREETETVTQTPVDWIQSVKENFGIDLDKELGNKQ